MRHIRTTAALASAAILVAGCGSDDGGGGAAGSLSATDRQQITAVIKRSLTSDAPGSTCNSFSPQLVREIYRTRAACTKSEKPDPDQNSAEDVKVSGLDGGGDSAAAHVEIVGGDVDGADGGFGMVKQAGRWQIGRLQTDFLRSVLSTAVTKADLGGESGLNANSGRTCLQTAVKGLPEAQVRRFAYDSIAEREGSSKSFIPTVLRCQAKDPAGRKVLVDRFVQGVAQSIETKGAPAKVVACVRRRLAGAVKADDVVAQTLLRQSGKSDTNPALQRAVVAAIRTCSGGTAGSTGTIS